MFRVSVPAPPSSVSAVESVSPAAILASLIAENKSLAVVPVRVSTPVVRVIVLPVVIVKQPLNLHDFLIGQKSNSGQERM